MLLRQGEIISFILYDDDYTNYSSGEYIILNASEEILDPDAWNNIVVTYDGGSGNYSLKFYKNGSLYENVDYSDGLGSFTGVNQVSQPFYLGSRVQDNGTPHLGMSGKLDQLIIWNTALNESQIQSYFSSPPGSNAANVVGYWSFDEGIGSVIGDESPNNSDGAVNGATWDASNAYQSMAVVETVNAGQNSVTLSEKTNFIEYDFQVSAMDTAGNESSLSSKITAIPYGQQNVSSMVFDGDNDYADPQALFPDVTNTFTISVGKTSN